MWKDLLYKSAWTCLMTIVRICDVIWRYITGFYYTSVNLWRYCRPHSIYKEFLCIFRCKAELSKIPKHLSVVIGSERSRPYILSSIAVYALLADIDYISFYDIKGELSLQDIKIPRYILSHKLHNGRFIWIMPSDRQNSRYLRYKNGMEKSIEVLNLSYNDGKPLLADVCKELFQKRNTPDVQQDIKDKEYFSARIDETLRKRLNNLPDVELAIIFDRNMCTFGLLPWHTGFTEFHFVNNDECFNEQTFVDILYKFSKCDRRFGK